MKFHMNFMPLEAPTIFIISYHQYQRCSLISFKGAVSILAPLNGQFESTSYSFMQKWLAKLCAIIISLVHAVSISHTACLKKGTNKPLNILCI